MVCMQVMGLDAAVAFAGSQGNLQLNVTRPLVIMNTLHASRLLRDAAKAFREFSVEGTTLNNARIQKYIDNSLMLVTALAPVVGYDGAARIAHMGDVEGLSLKEAALKSGLIDEKQFDEHVKPRLMAGHGVEGA